MAHPIIFSLRTKIILPYLILALLIASGAAYIVTRVAADSIEERFVNQLIEAGKLSNEWMVKEENRLLETLRYITHVNGIATSITQQDAESLRELLYPIVVNAGEEAVDVVDTHGVTLLSMHHRAGGKLEEYEYSRGSTVFQNLGWVQETLQGKADSFGDKYAALMPLGSVTFLYIAAPIFDDQGTLVGVALIGKSANTLVRQMREATLAQVTLYHSNGTILASTFLDSRALSTWRAADTIAQTDQASLVQDIRVSNIDYSEIVGTWQVRHGNQIGWLGTAFAKNFIVRLSQNTWLQILWSTLVGFLLVIGIGWVISYRISKPIMQLEIAAAQVATGNLSVQVTPNGNDEVTVLTERFNQMVAGLYTSKQDLLAAYDTTIEGWSKALDMRDCDTGVHSLHVSELTVRLAQAMGVPQDQMDIIRRGALLHDIGKMGVPDHILRKPGALDANEWAIMRKHPLYAIEMLKNINFLKSVMDIPAYHHEHWDGSGYPFGLQGAQIPLVARIFAVVDVWDALLSDRPYRQALTPERARAILQEGMGHIFDPNIVTAFFKMLDEDSDEATT